ncbi:putative B3 domain-containing protein REM15 [Lycium barbarum]|uniref:putative B3 domain-containing protein REM15 n=1 Tax=Lycium barbarum TaxID=112863 RepID=UPI00293E50C3|nr:putative B3 domain-containing protein REM15 [Lycium barbarum]
MDISYSSIDSEDMPDIDFENEGQILASFEVFMADSYIKHDDLYIPKKNYEHLPPNAHTALLDFRGEPWVATLTVGARRQLREGWSSFVQSNNIRAGCILKISLVGTNVTVVAFEI